MATKFEIFDASDEDAARIAAIHLAAMDSNILLHAQFPTAQSLVNLEEFLAEHTRSQLRDPLSGVLVARHPESGKIVSFAKWELPEVPQAVKQETETFKWSDGCCQEHTKFALILRPSWQRLVVFLSLACHVRPSGGLPNHERTALQVGLAGDRTSPRARSKGLAPDPNDDFFEISHADVALTVGLTFVCTDPTFQGKGAGSLLTRRVQAAAAAADLPVYLESTVEAVKMYEKLGFVALDGFRMSIPRRGRKGETEVYKEVCMLWKPSTA